MFEFGQRVRCKRYGEGVVSYIDEYGVYQVYVDFDKNGAWESYTKDGKMFEGDEEPSLSVIE